jgi:large subunit ribosomal protein L20
MARIKRAVAGKPRRKKILKAAKGQQGARSRLLRVAKNAVIKAWTYAYRDRRVKKRTFRRLWIARLSAAARGRGLTYSRLMHLLDQRGVGLDRKVLADVAVQDPAGFDRLVSFLTSAP